MTFIRPGGFRIALVVGALALLLGGAGAGYWFYHSILRDLPDLKSVRDFRPPIASVVLDRNGREIGEFFKQHRQIAPLESIPRLTRLAFVAAEDENFFEHSGIDYQAILRAAWVDLRAGTIKEGASTITMQLVKQLLLSPERKFRRKFREMILARRIESRFSKDEILYLYLNQIYFGHGAWGIAEAAHTYFGKDVKDLSVSESAMLAGLPQRPSEYSPFRNPAAAERRRESVIRRMLKMGVLDREGFEAAMKDVPVLASEDPNPDFQDAAYFTEEVRRYLYDRLGGDTVLEGGLTIETTLDAGLQHVAVKAVEDGLEAHDHRYGYRGPVRHVKPEDIEGEIQKVAVENGLVPEEPKAAPSPEDAAATSDAEDAGEDDTVSDPEAQALADAAFAKATGAETTPGEAEAAGTEAGAKEEAAPLQIPADKPVLGVVTDVDTRAQTARVAFAPGLFAEVYLADVDWAHTPQPEHPPRTVTRIADVFSRGDVAHFTLLAPGASKAPEPDPPKPHAGEEPTPPLPRVALYQVPEVEGALLSLEIKSGDVLAMVGGRDQEHSEFNRAIQAMRQPGSSFKPFIYGAALSRGYTPVSILYDRPVVVEDQESGFVWRPRNYSRHFFGPMPMRKALAHSVNNATVHLFRDVGVDYVIDYARRMGIHTPLTRDLTLALGSSDVTLLELTKAYAVFPNGGRRVVPRFIRRVTDRDGKVLLEDVVLGSSPEAKPTDANGTDANGTDANGTDANGTDANGTDAKGKDDSNGYPDGENVPNDRIIPAGEAFLMCDLLRDVIQEGTGRGVKFLGNNLGGKTGTTNDQADAWFMGFSPDITTGVWVGYDSVKRLGWGETGARAALPIWRDFMKVALAQRPKRDFEAPPDIVYERVDPETGLLADANTRGAYFQPFLEDTAPTETASKRSKVTDTRRALREDAFQ